MKHASRTARWMAGCLLALWCVAFLRAETTEKSMVRALFLRQGGQGWTVSLLYQFPEAAADASDAEAEIRACTAEGKTLERAIQTAEQALPKTANYRLCEYLLFDEAASQTELPLLSFLDFNFVDTWQPPFHLWKSNSSNSQKHSFLVML